MSPVSSNGVSVPESAFKEKADCKIEWHTTIINQLSSTLQPAPKKSLKDRISQTSSNKVEQVADVCHHLATDGLPLSALL